MKVEYNDTERMNWLEHHGSVLRFDWLGSIMGAPAWYTTGREPQYKRPRYSTAREAIDAAIREASRS